MARSSIGFCLFVASLCLGMTMRALPSRAEQTQGLQVYGAAYFQESKHFVSSLNGGTDIFPMPTGAIGLSYILPIGSNWSIGPDFHGTIPVSHGSGASSYTMSVGVPFISSPMPLLKLLIGGAMNMKGVYGDGGTATLNNGGGTATFYVASKNVIGLAPAIVTGFHLHVGHRFVLRFHTHILVPLSNSRRQFNILMGVGAWI